MLNNRHILFGDIIVILCVLMLALLLFVFNISPDSKSDTFSLKTETETTIYSLKDDREFSVSSNGYHFDVQVKNDYVCIVNSNCPDLTCVKMGKASSVGDVIVCLPAKLIIKIESGELRYDSDATAG